MSSHSSQMRNLAKWLRTGRSPRFAPMTASILKQPFVRPTSSAALSKIRWDTGLPARLLPFPVLTNSFPDIGAFFPDILRTGKRPVTLCKRTGYPSNSRQFWAKSAQICRFSLFFPSQQDFDAKPVRAGLCPPPLSHLKSDWHSKFIAPQFTVPPCQTLTVTQLTLPPLPGRWQILPQAGWGGILCKA